MFFYTFLFTDLILNTQQVALTAVNPEPCISFTAVADDLGLEGKEMLTLSLSGPSNIMFQNVSLTVIIDDGDGMYLHGNLSNQDTLRIRTVARMSNSFAIDPVKTVK